MVVVTVDREQVRRDAEAWRRHPTREIVLAILVEREQAERERDEAQENRRDLSAENAALRSRLAAVLALVEALRREHPGHGPTGHAPWVRDCDTCAALSVWEQAQG